MESLICCGITSLLATQVLCQNQPGASAWCLTKTLRPPPKPPSPPQCKSIENIIYALNLCYVSLRKTKRPVFVRHTSWHFKGNQPHMIWQRVSDERFREGERARAKRHRSLSGWKCQRALGCAFSTCGSCHLFFFTLFSNALMTPVCFILGVFLSTYILFIKNKFTATRFLAHHHPPCIYILLPLIPHLPSILFWLFAPAEAGASSPVTGHSHCSRSDLATENVLTEYNGALPPHLQ